MIDQDGEQAGIVSIQQALDMAEQAELDLVEISPNARATSVSHYELR
ncbi:hypothetical protein ACTG5T_10160 [Pasteurella multocida]